MPRVTTHVKSFQGKDYTCTECGQVIKPGQKYYAWTKRNSPRKCRHFSCGYPRPSELSSAKTAPIDDAVRSANNSITNLDGESDSFIDDIKSHLQGVANEATSVAEEYNSSVDNMPEGLQNSGQADAMRDVADRLEDWANELETWEPDDERPEDEDELDSWASTIKDDACDKMSEVPYYEG